jgi:hypothetical protein
MNIFLAGSKAWHGYQLLLACDLPTLRTRDRGAMGFLDTSTLLPNDEPVQWLVFA